VAAALDDDLDRLYGLPLDEFTAARNELAAALRKEGRKQEADEVKALQKPSVAAWTVNQLARTQRKAIGQLLELAESQREALGRGDTAAMREAGERERTVVRELVAAARRILREQERGSDAVVEKIATTLRAAPGDPDARALLERGRLAREVEATGFGALAGVQPRPAPDRRAEKRERAKELRAQVRELQRRARELAREADRAEAAAAAARAEADEAAEAAARAEHELELLESSK
jgi:hypothetical protein